MSAAEQIRDAAALVLVRPSATGAQVLMGQRGARAVFMPSKYVFPGGASGAEDLPGDLSPLAPLCAARLARGSDSPGALVTAALRELEEETGQSFHPGAVRLRYIFRAITPPGDTRRFDARFFLADAAALQTDPLDFSQAEDELSHLHWIGLTEARALDLPFITEIVLSEVGNLLRGGSQPGVPFFDNSGSRPQFHRIL
ncbi:NUDIX hydrolase [Pseudogemmobacter faecipullorum]|uniref:NUDIX hydrolase n=1 Tax=Pseudogemmobacter faecipullorum TaxID=2755041 RepID=A0ABS8CKE8_9RHOB|nr:NUDIX hydrolase [Pseudogemmobacter faecipullorum]MCB5409866.1 NUDIX hydrolase [Pseudogemmobacter faecipullorum]